MDILGKARKLESQLARTLETAVQGVIGRTTRQPIEVVHAIVTAAEQQLQPGGRGRRVFPFNRLTVHVAAPSRAERARFAALVEEPPSLRDRVVERLRAAGCDAGNLQIDVVYAPKPKAGWLTPEYHVDFERIEKAPAPAPAPAAAPPRLDLAIVSGSAARKAYTFAGGRIDIGRRAEVVDGRQRLVRTNQLAFTDDGSETNKTVSRKHAHIVYLAPSREYRLRDDGSAHGTAVLRDGHTIPVPQGSRGIRLQSGDDVVFGQAKVRVRIHE